MKHPRLILTLITALTIITASATPSPKGKDKDSDETSGVEKIRSDKGTSLFAYPIEAFVAGAANVGITEILKDQITAPRPLGNGDDSMPSRHTSWTFTGTTLVAMELTWRSPWIGLSCYAAGSAMGIQRVISRNHYPGDVFAGAGVGTFSAIIGHVAANAIFGSPHRYPRIRDIYFDYTPYLAVSTGASFPLNSHYSGARIGTGMYTSILGVVPMSSNWGVTARALLSSAPVKMQPENVYVEPVTRLGILAGANAEFAPCDIPISFGASAELGYCRTLHTRTLNVTKNSPMLRGGVSVAMPITTMFTIALNGGYELSRLSIGNCGKTLQTITLDLSTRAYF